MLYTFLIVSVADCLNGLAKFADVTDFLSRYLTMKTASPGRSHHMFADRLCVTCCCFAGLVLQAGLVTEHDYSLSPVRLDTGITILRDLTGSRLSRHVITKLIFVIFTFKNNVTRYRKTVNRPSPAHVISPL